MKKPVRIPTLLGIFLVIAGILLIMVLIKQATDVVIKSFTTVAPKNIRLTNLSDSKFTVSFVTDQPVVASLKYGTTSSLTETALDDRDALTGKSEPSQTHYITISNLKPNRSYYFQIMIGKKNYGAKVISKTPTTCRDFLAAVPLGEPFKVKTLNAQKVSCRETPLNGEVVNLQRLPAQGAIICIEMENVLPVSDLVKKNGKWVIPCYNLALKNGQGFLEKLDDNLKETIYIETGLDQPVKITNKTGNDNPVSLIALGKSNYDLTRSPLIAPIKVPTQGFPSPSITSPTLILISPQGTITDDLPTIRGRGKPNQVLKIEIDNNSLLSGTIVIDENGNWSFTSPQNLSRGDHIVVITAIDENGNQQVINKNFSIIGNNPLLPINAGTNSGQPSLIPTPSLILMPTLPITTPTTGLLTNQPTPIIELSPTATATPSGSLPNTANKIPIFILLTLAVIFFTVGLRIIFVKR